MTSEDKAISLNIRKLRIAILNILDSNNPNAVIESIAKIADNETYALPVIKMLAESLPTLPYNSKVDYRPLLDIKGPNHKSVLSEILTISRELPVYSNFEAIYPFLKGDDFLPQNTYAENPLSRLNEASETYQLKVKATLLKSTLSPIKALDGDIARYLRSMYSPKAVHLILSNVASHEAILDHLTFLMFENSILDVNTLDYIGNYDDKPNFNITGTTYALINKFGDEAVFNMVLNETEFSVVSGISKKEPMEIMMMNLPPHVMSLALSFLS